MAAGTRRHRSGAAGGGGTVALLCPRPALLVPRARGACLAAICSRYAQRSREEIRGFFGGLELVPPGVVSVRDWSGGGPALNLEPRTATFVAGVARKANEN
jgi:S-adenosyl methyltransferase